MSQNAFRRTDQIGMFCLLSSQGDNNGGGVGQGNASSNGGPTRERRALKMKKEEHAAKEAFDVGAFAQLLNGPAGRKTGVVLLPLRILGDDGYSAQNGVDPTEDPQAPIASIQMDDPRGDAVEAKCPL